jgi:hypothetical protein
MREATLAALGSLTLALPPGAHAGSLASGPSPAPHGCWGPVEAMVVLAGAVLVLAAVSSVRGRRLLLAGLLVVLAFETGIHGAHHASEDPAPKCPLAAASAHCVATEVEPVTLAPGAVAAGPSWLPAVPRAISRRPAARRTRAPPRPLEPVTVGESVSPGRPPRKPARSASPHCPR